MDYQSTADKLDGAMGRLAETEAKIRQKYANMNEKIENIRKSGAENSEKMEAESQLRAAKKIARRENSAAALNAIQNNGVKMSEENGNEAGLIECSGDGLIECSGDGGSLDDEPQQILVLNEQAEERLKELDISCQSNIDSKFESFQHETNLTFDSRMKNLGERYQTHSRDSISTIQTDVLRVNKIIREVSRALGTDWHQVFKFLMMDAPSEEVVKDIARLEKLKPLMQAYMSLQVWRDNMGDDFQVHNLVAALTSCDKKDLAEKVMNIAEREDKDSLMNLKDFGTSGSTASKPADPSERGGTRRANKRASLIMDDTPEDPLCDRKFLQISKQLGEDWMKLACALRIPEEEVADIKGSENGYQAAFKLLWSWRDSIVGTNVNGPHQLNMALNNIGRSDLAELIVSPYKPSAPL